MTNWKVKPKYPTVLTEVTMGNKSLVAMEIPLGREGPQKGTIYEGFFIKAVALPKNSFRNDEVKIVEVRTYRDEPELSKKARKALEKQYPDREYECDIVRGKFVIWQYNDQEPIDISKSEEIMCEEEADLITWAKTVLKQTCECS